MAECCEHHTHSHAAAGEPNDATIVIDPVCGMKVYTRTAQHRYELAGTPYYFCSARCLERFRSDPDHYLNPAAHDPAVTSPTLGALPEAAEGTIWTCPMHPEIRRDAPGSCPICGMALEPLEPVAEEGPNRELIDMSRRFWISAAFTLPLIVHVMANELTSWHPLPMSWSMWLQLALATPVVLWGGWPFFERFGASLKTRNLNMFHPHRARCFTSWIMQSGPASTIQ